MILILLFKLHLKIYINLRLFIVLFLFILFIVVCDTWSYIRHLWILKSLVYTVSLASINVRNTVSLIDILYITWVKIISIAIYRRSVHIHIISLNITWIIVYGRDWFVPYSVCLSFLFLFLSAHLHFMFIMLVFVEWI